MTNLDNISVNDLMGISDANDHNVAGVHLAILNYVKEYNEGVTAQMVADQVNLSLTHTRDILDDFCGKRELYKRKVPGIKQSLYYPNGKLIHKYLQNSRDMGDQIFRISFHEGWKTPRVQIQERKYTLLEGEKIEGSIFIDLNNLTPLMDFLNEMMIQYNTYGEKRKA
jgi:hypothetical protein